MPPESHVKRTESEFILGGCYHVAYSDCDSPEKIELRVEELMQADWAMPWLLRDFIVNDLRRPAGSADGRPDFRRLDGCETAADGPEGTESRQTEK